MAKEELAVDQDELEDDQEDQTEEEESPEAKALARLKEAIDVQREDMGGLRVKLTVTVPREITEERLNDQFAELKREAIIPGFRRGHAPLKLIEKRFAGEVGDELKGKLISSGYLAATERENLKTLGDPLIWVRTKEQRIGPDQKPRQVDVDKLLPFEKALEAMSMPKEGPLTFSCEVELRPEFDLPELSKIPVKRPTVNIEDEDVDAEIDRLASWRGTFEPVEDGPVKEDDLLYASMTMTVDGETIAKDDNLEVPARDVRVKGVSLVGLGKALKGKKSGDKVSIDAEVPDDHENINARGKKARFDFTIREIKRWVAPPVDAEFLTSMGYDSEDELRNQVRSTLESRLQRTLKEKMLEQVGDYLVDQVTFDVPEGLSQRQTDRSIARRAVELLQRGVPRNEVEKTLDQMRGQAREQVVRDLKLFFTLEKIAEDREIDVNEEEVNAAISDIARATGKRFDRVRDELSKQDGMMSLFLRLRDQKVLDTLLADAEITDVEGPQRKSTKKPSEKSKPDKTEHTEEPKAKSRAAKDEEREEHKVKPNAPRDQEKGQAKPKTKMEDPKKSEPKPKSKPGARGESSTKAEGKKKKK